MCNCQQVWICERVSARDLPHAAITFSARGFQSTNTGILKTKNRVHDNHVRTQCARTCALNKATWFENLSVRGFRSGHPPASCTEKLTLLAVRNRVHVERCLLLKSFSPRGFLIGWLLSLAKHTRFY